MSYTFNSAIRRKCSCGNISICECGGCAIHCTHPEDPSLMKEFIKSLEFSRRLPEPRVIRGSRKSYRVFGLGDNDNR